MKQAQLEPNQRDLRMSTDSPALEGWGRRIASSRSARASHMHSKTLSYKTENKTSPPGKKSDLRWVWPWMARHNALKSAMAAASTSPLQGLHLVPGWMLCPSQFMHGDPNPMGDAIRRGLLGGGAEVMRVKPSDWDHGPYKSIPREVSPP